MITDKKKIPQPMGFIRVHPWLNLLVRFLFNYGGTEDTEFNQEKEPVVFSGLAFVFSVV
jgi:hypothetical protein